MKELKRKWKIRNMEKTKGITMVSLVITIILLLILSGITVSFLFGNNGIITRANNAKKTYEISSIKEEIQMKILDKEMEKTKTGGSITQVDVEKILKEYGEVNKNEDGTIKNLITKDKNYEIPYEEIYNSKLSQEEGSGSSGGNNTGDVAISREEYNNLIERLDAIDGGNKSSLSLGDINNRLSHTENNMPIFNKINKRQAFTSSTTLKYTGVNITIPDNSYFSITADCYIGTAKATEVAFSNRSDSVNSATLFSTSTYSDYYASSNLSAYVEKETVLYIFAKYTGIGNQSIYLTGYYVTFPEKIN